MTFRIAQISDAHLSRDRPFFNESFRRVAEHVRTAAPDLVINTGDMALDGPARESDLAEARRLHGELDVPCRFIPGNHDLGEAQDAPAHHPALAPITHERRGRYLEHFGEDFWHLDVPGWRLVAVNAQLLGSDLAAARGQLDFLREAMDGSGGRCVALFIHKPLFHLSPDEEIVGGRFVNPEPRRALLDILRINRPALVCSGHVHQYLSHRVEGGAHHVWAPSTGFVIPDDRQPVYGLKQVGYVAHRLEADGTHHGELVTVPGLPTLSITDFAAAYQPS